MIPTGVDINDILYEPFSYFDYTTNQTINTSLSQIITEHSDLKRKVQHLEQALADHIYPREEDK